VKDRFKEVYISRQDIEYVIAQRLLRKDARQRDLVRKHLEKFTGLYGGIQEQMGRYIDLFPVHPKYIEVFERIRFVEKREILKTLSRTIDKLLDVEVPHDDVGLITYDSYWEAIKRDASFKAIPDVREVIDKSQILENKMDSLPRPHYKPIALRLIYALSVFRLTADVRDPIGTTSEELKDHLCLPFPAEVPASLKNDEFLRQNVEMILDQIMKTVSGQYLSLNKENGQYYLDLEKDVDYDQLIRDKADSLDDATYDRYYFNALAKLMECTDSTYVPGFRIWEHELVWTQRGTTRLGYLFFGAPNDRSTAQPPRDFYIYFLPFFESKPFSNENKSDEVFFKLVEPEDKLLENVKLYAGAGELERNTVVGSRQIFRSKADSFSREITKWLYANSTKNYDIIYQGQTKKPITFLKQSSAELTFQELVDQVSSNCLSTHFEDQAPEYPKFSVTITYSNRDQVVKDALRALSTDTMTRMGTAVLDGLELLDGSIIKPTKSKYSEHVLSLLKSKGEGQVLNRDELIHSVFGVEFEKRFRLEPELLMVVLAALVRDGRIILSIPGAKFDAASLEDLAKTSLGDLIGFKHLEVPKGFPIGALRTLFEILGIPPGLVNNPDTLDEAVRQLQEKVEGFVNRVVEVQQRIKSGLPLMGVMLLDEAELVKTGEALDSLKRFLESLQPYNSPGRLRNFPYAPAYVDKMRDNLSVLKQVEYLNNLVSDVSNLISYLTGAEAVLPSDEAWNEEFRELKKRFAPMLRDSDTRFKALFKDEMMNELSTLKKDYVQLYMKMHGRSRLDAQYDAVKARLVKDKKMERLNRLASIELLPRNRLNDYHNRLGALKSCFQLKEEDLDSQPVCPHPQCNYKPIEEPLRGVASKLILEYEDELETINDEWDQILLNNLKDPMVQENISLLKDDERKLIQPILDSGEVPDDITNELLRLLSELYSGLEKVEVNSGSLVQDLIHGGMPCTVDEYRKRFEGHLKRLVEGRDQNKIRIILEE